MTIISAIRRVLSDTSGNAMMFFAAALVPMMGCVGLAIDAAQWVLWKRQLHSAADLGALAGARALADKNNVSVAVRRSLSHNEYRSFVIDAIENAPTVGTFKDDDTKVRVVLSVSKALPFSGMFLKNPPKVSVQAIAENAKTVPNCVIALDNADTALSIAGSASVDMNCGLASNSNLDATSSDLINAGALSAVGTVNAGAAVTADTAINSGVSAEGDPVAGRLPTLSIPSPCNAYFTNGSKAVETISPGCYAGITVRGNLTLSPGVYYIDGGSVTVNAGAILKGNGVTIIYTNSDPSASASIGKFTAKGSSIVNLSASTSGDYAGILMYQDGRATTGDKLFLTGTSGTDTGGGPLRSSYEGTIYTPNGAAEFSGNSSIDTPCMQIVAWQVNFIGNTSVTNNCPSGSGSAAYGGYGSIRLVG